MEAVRIGPALRGDAAPDSSVIVTDDDAPALRIDLYKFKDECYAFCDAIIWSSFAMIGWGDRAYAVDLAGGSPRCFPLGSYYGHMYPHGDVLLIASAQSLHCVGSDGSLIWRSDDLGIDGVIVDRINDDSIEGEGEWDPPDGWRPFRLHLGTGKLLPQ